MGRMGINQKDKEPIDPVTKMGVSIASHFSHGDSVRAIHQIPGIYRGSLEKRQKPKKVRPCFFTKSVKFGRTEVSLMRVEALGEIYNLSMVSRPVS